MSGHADPEILEVVDPGVLATIQDAGRPGLGSLGISAGGAADPITFRVANELLGNDPGSAALEITAGPVRLRALRHCVVAVAGGIAASASERQEGGVQARSLALAPDTDVELTPSPGLRAYLAVPGGVRAPIVLGSRSTDLRGGFGGHGGRALRPGDRLAAAGRDARPAGLSWQGPSTGTGPIVRVVAGPHADLLGPRACAGLAATTWTVRTESDRQGLRLDGDPLPGPKRGELPSLGVLPGTIQVPPDGRPVILGPDCQPTGGYPVIGMVAAVDRPLIGQLRPGDLVRLEWITADDARRALDQRDEALRSALGHLRDAATWDHLSQDARG